MDGYREFYWGNEGKKYFGFYKDDFIAFTVEDIQNELKFLIGANISLKQNLNSGGYRENKVTVLGTFDRLNRRMVDE